MNWLTRRRLYRAASQSFIEGQRDAGSDLGRSPMNMDAALRIAYDAGFDDNAARPARRMPASAWAEVMAERQRP